MSEDEDFSISDLRRKREQASSGSRPRPGGPPPREPDTIIQTSPSMPSGPAPGAPRRPRVEEEEESQSEWSVDVWRVLGAMKRYWYWLAAGAAALGCLGFIGGYLKGKYSASIELIQNTSFATETFQPEALTPATLVKLIQSPELVRRVAAKAKPPVDASTLSDSLKVVNIDKSELATITIEGQDADTLADLVNLYAQEAVDFTKELQLAGARRSTEFYREKVELFDAEVRRANSNLTAFLNAHKLVDPHIESESYVKQLADTLSQKMDKEIEEQLVQSKIQSLQAQLKEQDPLAEQLASAQARLVSLLAKFTDQHPLVQDTQAEIETLQRRIKESSNTSDSKTHFPVGSLGAAMQKELFELQAREVSLKQEAQQLENQLTKLQKTASGLSELELDYSGLKADFDSLQKTRNSMAASLREAELHEQRSRGFYRVVNPISRADVNTKPRIKMAISTGMKGTFAGLMLAALAVFLVEMKDRTMKTVAEVERVTGLRVLGALGDLDKMTEAEQDKWAFRTWTIIAGQLNMSANRGMVCGVMSSLHGEGRSTWIRLLGNAASRRGLRVLTVATKPSTTDPEKNEAETEANEKSFTDAVAEAMADSEATKRERGYDPNYMALDENPLPEPETLSPNVLAFPAEVTQKFNEGGLPAAHIPLPGWVWSLERRRQWQTALMHWRSVDNLVLLVELPPASVPESVLLAENLPQILWLVDSGKPRIRETKEQLEMLHHARCRIVGAVLNHEPEPIIKL